MTERMNAAGGPPHRGVLLLGPTGSGKTPLGELLQRRGLWGSRCVHFDFGARLRAIAGRDRPDAHVSREDIEFVRGVLARGELLEDRDFPLAARILRSFLDRNAAGAATRVVLNGLPRHVGQADALAAIVAVTAVIRLSCSAETVWQRILANVGGDREGRVDDDREAVRRKLDLFAERTAPLVEHYRSAGVPVVTLDVTSAMTPDEMCETLQSLSREIA